MLAQLDQTLASQGLVLAFAEMKDPVKDQMKQLGLFAQVGEEHFFPTLGQAVNGYLEETGTEWHDWEDTAAAR
jgi:MFS superfamily sulfate permease-like transporter